AILELIERDAELIPFYLFLTPVAQLNFGGVHVSDEILTDLHVLRAERYPVLVILLGLIHVVVAVDVFAIGEEGRRRGFHTHGLLWRFGVPFRSIEPLIALK